MRYLHKSKKTLAAVMAVMTFASTLDFAGYKPVFADTLPASNDEQTYHWELSEDGVLSFGKLEDGTGVVSNAKADWNQLYKSNVKKIVFDEDMTISNGSSLFSDMNQLEEVDLSDVTINSSTSYMFGNCVKLTVTADTFKNVNTDNVTNMSGMFQNCDAITTFEGLNTANVTDMGNMFDNCNNLVSVSGLSTDKATSMYRMFYSCTNLKGITGNNDGTIDLTGFNLEKVTTMRDMFCDCDAIKNVNMSGVNIPKVTSMLYMFEGCNNLEQADLSNVNTEASVSFFRLFNGCNNLKTIDLTEINTPNLVNTSAMFLNCANLTVTADTFKDLDTENVTDMSGMFQNCDAITTFEGLNTANVTDMGNMFDNCNNLVSVSGLSTDKATSMYRMFYSCTNLKGITGNNDGIIDLTGFNLENVTTMKEMFYNCDEIKNVNMSGVNIPKVTNMYEMFSDSDGIEQVDMSNMNAPLLKSFESVFESCDNLSKVNIFGENVASVNNCYYMFAGCKKLRDLDISGINFESNCNITNFVYANNSPHFIRLVLPKSAPVGIATYMTDDRNGIWYAQESGETFTNIVDLFNYNSTMEADKETYIFKPILENIDKFSITTDTVYNGKPQEANVIVSYEDIVAIPGVDYTVTYVNPDSTTSNTTSNIITINTIEGGMFASGVIENYELKFQKAEPVIEAEEEQVFEYTGAPIKGINYNVTSGVLDDEGIAEIPTGRVTVDYYRNEACTTTIAKPKNVGEYWAKVTVASDDHFNKKVSKAIHVIIEKASVEIQAEATGYHYTGEEIADPAYELVDNVANEDSNGEVTINYYTDKSCAEEFKMDGKPVEKGLYYCVIDLAATESFKSATKTIPVGIDAPILTADYRAYKYDGKVKKYTGYKVKDPFTGKDIKDAVVTVEYFKDEACTIPAVEVKNVGYYFAKVTVAEYGDYVSVSVVGKFNIKRAPVTLTVEPQEETFNGAKINFTNYTIGGRVFDEHNNPVDEGPTGAIIRGYYTDPACTEDSKKEPREAGLYYVKIRIAAAGNYDGTEFQTTTLRIKPATPRLVVSDAKPFWTGDPIKFSNYKLYNVNGHALSINPDNMEFEYFYDENGENKMTELPKDLGVYYVRARYVAPEGFNYGSTDWSDIVKMSIKYMPVVSLESKTVPYDGLNHGVDTPYVIEGDNNNFALKYFSEYKNNEDKVYTGPEDGALVEGGEPSEPGTYIVKLQYYNTTNYHAKAFYTTLTILEPEESEFNDIIPRHMYTFSGYTGYDPRFFNRECDEIGLEELSQIEELNGYDLNELKLEYHFFSIPSIHVNPDGSTIGFLNPPMDDSEIPKTESGAPLMEGSYWVDVLIADGNGGYRSLLDELHFQINWTLNLLLL
ncbi:MAG: BspA family leucine-rich repeat surface protein [Lachnospiraceae bacterium]|nr:BspA family leucine-rich repeat surface protein [Lachnospiraceae bacterium]